MLSGKRFRLNEETIAIEALGRKRVATLVPTGSVITVESGPRPDDHRMVDVLWDGRKIVMFAVDIEKRGQEVSETSGMRRCDNTDSSTHASQETPMLGPPEGEQTCG